MTDNSAHEWQQMTLRLPRDSMLPVPGNEGATVFGQGPKWRFVPEDDQIEATYTPLEWQWATLVHDEVVEWWVKQYRFVNGGQRWSTDAFGKTDKRMEGRSR